MNKHLVKKKSLLLGLGLLLLCANAPAQRFLPDDPLKVDHDRIPIPMPQPMDRSQILDFMEKTFMRGPEEDIPRAQNVNTLGEVPDSTWFTNRMGTRIMTIDELVRGPNQLEGPDVSRPWIITKAKTEGVSPGFRIKDGRGDTYFIKFDAENYPQLATSTEVIVTKFFHAFGYHVPENYLAFIKREQLEPGPDTVVTMHGKTRKMNQKDIDRVLKQVARRSDGTIQVIASRKLSGKPLGPFQYFGVRQDDPNDIFPHEHRRELRGLRVLAVWVNHDDAKSLNSLDTFISEDKNEKSGYVKHHLLDFGSTLGSSSVKPDHKQAGNEYLLEAGPLFKRAVTFGLWEAAWRDVDFPEYPSVGRFEGDFFDPGEWRPRYPNPAFDRMKNEDAFWATRMVMRFNDDMIRAIVRTGRLNDSEAENYLVQTLIKRRDKIVRRYLGQLNPLDDFQLTSSGGASALQFTNLGLTTGLASSAKYEYEWFAFDNRNQSFKPLGKAGSTRSTSLSVPNEDLQYMMVEIRSLSPEQANWNKAVKVFIRNGAGKSTVGIEREE